MALVIRQRAAAGSPEGTAMPLFFFDVVDGDQVSTDGNGIELPDQDRAREEATRTLAEIAEQELPGDGPQRHFKILVSDGNRKVLFEVHLDFNLVEDAEANAGDLRDERD
jgi:hypothetical protein